MLNEILIEAIGQRASDVHLNIGAPPLVRINKLIQSMECEPVSGEYMGRIIKRILDERRMKDFQAQRDANFSYEIPGVGRFRVNAHYQRNSWALSFRVIVKATATMENLYLPEIVGRLTRQPRGLVLVTGPAGSGKTTTLAAMVDTINKRDKGHIITLEDPIEYTFANERCLVEQRELGNDVTDFACGIRNALRQDPDTILISELRDLEATNAALAAAESGHLVLSTLHTLSGPETIQRILDMYPDGQQHQARSILACTLSAVVSQTLFRRADQPGMIPAVEVMVCNPAVRNCIRENRVFDIAKIVETSRSFGMQSMDSSIKQLFVGGLISREEAMGSMVQPERLERAQVA